MNLDVPSASEAKKVAEALNEAAYRQFFRDVEREVRTAVAIARTPIVLRRSMYKGPPQRFESAWETVIRLLSEQGYTVELKTEGKFGFSWYEVSIPGDKEEALQH